MTSLAAATRPRRTADGYVLDVPAGWRQGRGAFGGLCVAAMIRAAEHTAANARAVRSVTAELFAPVETGEHRLAADVLRHGNAVSVVRVAIAERAHAIVLLAAARRADLAWTDLAPPAAPAYADVADSPFGNPGGPWPEFAQHFEYRVVHGMPMAGGGAAVTVGWVRARDPGADRCDAGHVAAMIDAWYPAALVRMAAFRPLATIAYTLDLVGDPADLDPAAPLLYRGTAPVCRDGYFLETRELWVGERLVAVNQQTFAIIQ